MANWMCESGHLNEDVDPEQNPYCTYGPCLGMLAYDVDEGDKPGPWAVDDPETVACDPEQPPKEGKTEKCPGPHVSDSKYRIDETKGTVKKKTKSGNLHVFPLPTANTNSTDRPEMPKFMHSKKDGLETFPGAKSNGLVHPVIVDPLKKMLAAMKAEGERINDKALQEVYVKAPWRDPAKTGQGYLNALKGYIKEHNGCHKGDKKCVANKKWKKRCSPGFEKLKFPSSLEKEAKSELGKSGGTKWTTFKNNLGKAGNGWTSAHASYLLNAAKGWKAPAGGSPHHSGLVVDLDWPIYFKGQMTIKGKKKQVEGEMQLGTSSSRNEWGRKSAPGVWLNKHAAEFGFKSYDEAKEIWHMEYVKWKGTAAEPK